MKKCTQLCLLVCLSLLLTQALLAQTPFTVQILATDDGGVNDTGRVILAVHPSGTSGFDDLSPFAKEAELPPVTPTFDFRVAANAPKDAGLLLGSYTSIHQLVFDPQPDVWKLQIQRDVNQTDVEFTWPAGLATIVPGGAFSWLLKPDPSDPDGVTFSDVDMTSTTTFTLPLPNADPHYIYVVKSDGFMMRSFTPDEIADAVDSKGKKAKAEKRKPYASEWCFSWTNNHTDSVNGIHVEFSQEVTDISASGGWAYPPLVKLKKVNFTGTNYLHVGETIEICGHGNKGKQMVVGNWWWTVNGVMVGAKTKGIPPGPWRLMLKMPNINNIGEEIYLQNVYAGNLLASGKPAGLIVGDLAPVGSDSKGKPITKLVYHPKWKDVTKTLIDKTGKHLGAANCIFKDTKGKDYVKAQKSLPPGKQSNHLISQVVALKVNMGASTAEKIPAGFADLMYVPQPGDPAGLVADIPLTQLEDSLDEVMTCSAFATFSGTYAEWDSVVTRINRAFSGVFDTVTFGVDPGGKPGGGTTATGVKAVGEAQYLYRSSFNFTARPHDELDVNALEQLPEKFELAQNYPNPFNPTTTIEFSLPEDAVVSVMIYNMLGQEVARLAENEEFDAGLNEVTFDAASLASGVYYYRLVANGGQFQEVKKMMLVK